MAKAPASPLSAQDLEAVNMAIAKCNEVIALCQQCKACGYDTSTWDAYVAHIKPRLEAVQREFGGRKFR